MSMLANSRRFIRLDEISEKTNLTQGDILDAIDSGKLNFSALINTQNLGAIEGRVIIGVFDYNGLVKLPLDVSKQFSVNIDAQSVTAVTILLPELISCWRAVERTFGYLKPSRFDYSEQQTHQPEHQFLAYVRLIALPTMQNVMGSIASTLNTFFPNETSKELQSKYLDTKSESLQVTPITIEPARLRLDLQDISSLFGQNAIKQRALLSDVRELGSDCQLVLTHPIKQVITSVLVEHIEFKSRQIWNLVKQDVESGQKQFDKDAVIFEMTSDELSYFGLGDTTKTMTYRRFQNLISEVRQNLHG